MDHISLHQIECYGYHGVFAEENKLGQRFIVDLSVGLDLRKAGTEDDLFATVNYAEMAEQVKSIVEGKPFKLVESVAESIAAMLLQSYEQIQAVNVQVTKPNPPVALHFAGVSVNLYRTRESV